VLLRIINFSFGGKSVPDHLVGLMARDKPSEMQLAAARCLTYLHRAGSITADDPRIVYKTLPCLVSTIFCILGIVEIVSIIEEIIISIPMAVTIEKIWVD
jgi:hypothetical protein